MLPALTLSAANMPGCKKPAQKEHFLRALSAADFVPRKHSGRISAPRKSRREKFAQKRKKRTHCVRFFFGVRRCEGRENLIKERDRAVAKLLESYEQGSQKDYETYASRLDALRRKYAGL